MKKINKSFILGIILIIVLTALDQLSKLWVINNLKGKDAIVLIPGVFEFRYHGNTGAMFSTLLGQRTFFLIITPVILILVLICFYKFTKANKYKALQIIMTFLCAGAIGNYIDRLFNGGVVIDFLYFSLINFPIFNVADCYITVSMFFLLVLTIFIYKEDDFDEFSLIVFGKKGKK